MSCKSGPVKEFSAEVHSVNSDPEKIICWFMIPQKCGWWSIQGDPDFFVGYVRTLQSKSFYVSWPQRNLRWNLVFTLNPLLCTATREGNVSTPCPVILGQPYVPAGLESSLCAVAKEPRAPSSLRSARRRLRSDISCWLEKKSDCVAHPTFSLLGFIGQIIGKDLNEMSREAYKTAKLLFLMSLDSR